MNAGANHLLGSYMSLFGPFVPHALRGAVTKCRFNTPLSLVVDLAFVYEYLEYPFNPDSDAAQQAGRCPSR